MIGFIVTLYIHTVRDCRQYSTIAILHTLQFTVTHALGLSVFTSRILATGLSQSHCNFKSHVKSSGHSLIPFLTFLFNHFRLLSSELNPILSTTVLYSELRILTVPCYNSSAWTPRKHRLLLSRMRVYWSVT
jgi:hypothetical protein